jgi:hypothetical protein
VSNEQLECLLVVRFSGQNEFSIPGNFQTNEKTKLYINGDVYTQGTFFEIRDTKAIWKGEIMFPIVIGSTVKLIT